MTVLYNMPPGPLPFITTKTVREHETMLAWLFDTAKYKSWCFVLAYSEGKKKDSHFTV